MLDRFLLIELQGPKCIAGKHRTELHSIRCLCLHSTNQGLTIGLNHRSQFMHGIRRSLNPEAAYACSDQFRHQREKVQFLAEQQMIAPMLVPVSSIFPFRITLFMPDFP